MAHQYGSRILIDQVKNAVEAVGGELVELGTVFSVISADKSTTQPEPMPCLAHFPDEKSRNKFLDGVRRMPLYVELALPPPKQSKFKVSISIVIPTSFEPTKFMANIPKTSLLWLAVLERRLGEVDKGKNPTLWGKYNSHYKDARKIVLEASGYSINLETEQELNRMISEIHEEIKRSGQTNK